MSRVCKIGIQIGTGAVQDAQGTWGFYLIESPDILVPPQRDYETEVYPEKDGVQVYAKTTYEQFDYTVKLLCLGKQDEVNTIITKFYALIKDQKVSLWNYWKNVIIVGYPKAWNGETTYVNEGGFMFDLTIQVVNPQECKWSITETPVPSTNIVDTTDGDITPQTVLKGKIGYAMGNRVVGAMEAVIGSTTLWGLSDVLDTVKDSPVGSLLYKTSSTEWGYTAFPDFTKYATQQWVEGKGYITSSALSGLATETWVKQQGYLISTSLSGYATQSWVQQQGYLIDTSLANYATKTYITDQNFAKQTDLTTLTKREIVAGIGLSGGGTFEENRTLSLADSGVIAGTYTQVTVDRYGRVTLGSQSGGSEYKLPIASSTVLGGVKIGENLTIDSNGVLSATGGGGAPYILPTASPTIKGGIRIGSGLNMAGEVLSANVYAIYSATFIPGTFSAKTYTPNSAAQTINIPTSTSHITNDAGYLTPSTAYINAALFNLARIINGDCNAYITDRGTREINTPTNAPGAWPWIQTFNWGTTDTGYGTQLASAYTNNYGLWYRQKIAGSFTSWYELLSTRNYTSVLDSRYVLKSGDTMTGTLTINAVSSTPLTINAQSGAESFLKVDYYGGSKTAFGWFAPYGSYLYNYTSTKYLGIKDDGTPHYQGSTLLHAGNYNSYSPTLTGGGASGMWNISINGYASYLGSTYTGGGGYQPPSYFNNMGLKVNMMNVPVSYTDVIVVNGYGGIGADVPYINAIAFQKTPSDYGAVWHARGSYNGTSWGTWYKFWDSGNANRSDVDWAAKTITATGRIYANGAITASSWVEAGSISETSGTYYINDMAALGRTTNDYWLRLNQNGSFTSGIYCGNSTLRTDGSLQVGPGGQYFLANSFGTTVAGTIYSSAHIIANTHLLLNAASTNTGNGLSLYGNAAVGINSLPTYGIAFAGTSIFGKHGGVQGDWATYFTMSNINNRGWIFKFGSTGTGGNVASIDAAGNFVANGGVTALATGTSDMRLKDRIEYFRGIDYMKPIGKAFKHGWNEKARSVNCNLTDDITSFSWSAQAAKMVDPLLVIENFYQGTDYLGLHKEYMVPIVWNAVLEHEDEIVALKQDIEVLKCRVSELEYELSLKNAC